MLHAIKLKYLQNSFLFIIPILIWNLFLTKNLPPVYLDNFKTSIPSFITFGENIFRIIIMALPVFMMFSLSTKKQKVGLWLYLIGIVVYFLSWIVVILSPQSIWSTSLVGFSALAYTPIFWLTGIGLMNDSFYFKIQYKSWVYILLSVVFLAFHFTHVALIYYKIY